MVVLGGWGWGSCEQRSGGLRCRSCCLCRGGATGLFHPWSQRRLYPALAREG